MNSEDEKFGVLTEPYNISTILTYCQCFFVTSHFNKCIARFYQFLEMPEAAEVHVTMQILLLSFIFFMIIWRKMIKGSILTYSYEHHVPHTICLHVRCYKKKVFPRMICN